MLPRHSLPTLFATALLALLAACADLTAVRTFADQAAAVAEGTPLLDEYTATLERRCRWQQDDTDLQKELKARRTQLATLHAVEAAVANYLVTIGQLAADGAVDFTPEFTALAGKATEGGLLDADAAKAAGSIGAILTRWVTDGYRQAELGRLVKEADGPLQQVIAGLVTSCAAIQLSLDNEADEIGSRYRGLQSATANAANLLAGEKRVELLADLARKQAGLRQHAVALAKVAEGHAHLAAHIDELGTKQLLARMKGLAHDVNRLRAAVRSLEGR